MRRRLIQRQWPIAVPVDFAGTSTSYLHLGGGTGSKALFYRVKLLP